MRQSILIITILCIFFLGFFSNTVLSTSNIQIPFSTNATEKASPKDRISEDQILILPDKIIINVNQASWAKYTNTNSMDPLLDEEANGLEITPQNQEDLQVGDVIAYETNLGIIVHRIIQINEDEQGWYCITKGDNSNLADQKVRFEQVKFVLIGVIY